MDRYSKSASKAYKREIVFQAKGACQILGVDNRAVDNGQHFPLNRITASQGRARIILQLEFAPGNITGSENSNK